MPSGGVTPAGGGGSGLGLSTATVTLTNAQIIALPTTAIQLVAAPGASKVLVPFQAWFYVNWTADYTNIAATGFVSIAYGTGNQGALSPFQEDAGGQVTNLLADGASHHAFMGLSSYYNPAAASLQRSAGVGQFVDEPGVTNTALNVYATNAASGNFTGGDAANTIKVILYYTTLTLP